MFKLKGPRHNMWFLGKLKNLMGSRHVPILSLGRGVAVVVVVTPSSPRGVHPWSAGFAWTPPQIGLRLWTSCWLRPRPTA